MYRYDLTATRRTPGEPTWTKAQGSDRAYRPRTVHLHVSPQALELCLAYFHRPLTDGEWARLACAPEGAVVWVDPAPRPGRGILLRCEHPLLAAPTRSSLVSTSRGGVLFDMQSLSLVDEAPSLLGTRLFARLALQARRLGIQKLICEAASQLETPDGQVRPANGYYTWARLGYNFAFEPGRYRLPSELAACRDVLDLMRSEAGRGWWRKYGQGEEMEFDLHDDSKSLKTLFHYLDERGIAL